jgi:hypothetical protein
MTDDSKPKLLTTMYMDAARAICAERCAFKGEMPCWYLSGAPRDSKYCLPAECDDPGCYSLAVAAVNAIVGTDDSSEKESP